MYAIHTTPGFIIESRPSGEAGKLLSIFTRDLGLVWAIAQGIRLEKSKLRYHSQECSFGEFSFVRGKEFWRLTSANELIVERQSSTGGQISACEIGLRSGTQELISRVALLLRRLLRGEEAHPELFEHVEASFLFLENSNHSINPIHTANSTDPIKLSAEQLQTLESIIVFRILHLLGYIGTDKNLDARLGVEPFSLALLDETMGQRTNMNRHINKALRESHL